MGQKYLLRAEVSFTSKRLQGKELKMGLQVKLETFVYGPLVLLQELAMPSTVGVSSSRRFFFLPCS
jgi:hypothetical protein